MSDRPARLRDGLWQAPPFRAPRWARGPHAQTLLARVLRPAPDRAFRRERFETPDGDFLDVDWGPEPGPGAPIVLVLHGLEGSSKRRYVRNLARELSAHGLWPVAMNFRGCSGEPNRTPRFYHSGETGDPAWLLERLRLLHPDRSVGAVGFSLGGNVLLKMLGEGARGGRRLVDAAVAISVPYDLAAGCTLLERSLMGRLYSEYFLRSLRRKLSAKAGRLASEVDLTAAARVATIREFDDRVTAPLSGFRDAEEYYAECSSNRFLPGIRVPTLLLHAVDDPFLPAEAIPRSEAEANPAIELALRSTGGHVGFVRGSPRRPVFWAEETAASFLGRALRLPEDARSVEPTRGRDERSPG